MSLSARGLVVEFSGKRALDGVSIDVAPGSTLAIVGPSAAGKSTLLRVIAGLHRPNGGDVLLGGVSVNSLLPQQRRMAMVFQDDALFANMTVRDNLRFALRNGHRRDLARIEDTARALHVTETLGRRPHQLSGGERQRVSIARALLSDPAALLLDEPLAHLDPSLRRSVRDEVVGLRQRFTGPIVYVTHDHAEAMTVGDRIAILLEGRIEDAGEPQRVYDSPATLGVARFLGDRPANVFTDGDAYVAIRPERVRLSVTGNVRGRVVRRETTGADAYVHVTTPLGEITARVPASESVPDDVALDFPEEFVRRFDRATGRAL